jgi:hypothetical protein
MPAFKDKTGERFGRLVVLRLGKKGKSHHRWHCRCDCGNVVEVFTCNLSYNLNRGKTQSCGCLQRERTSQAKFIHGHSAYPRKSNASPTYNSWNAMMRRCYDEKFFRYPQYGARGIYVAKRWHTFKNFLDDVGERPHNKTLDRYPNRNGNYIPSNVRWATAKQQRANQESRHGR